jgi:hypothetical protein
MSVTVTTSNCLFDMMSELFKKLFEKPFPSPTLFLRYFFPRPIEIASFRELER